LRWWELRLFYPAGATKRASHMTYAKPLVTSAGAAALCQPYPPRVGLKAQQHAQIAAVYAKAATDKSLPAHTRAAFRKKADWFRLLARVGEKRKRATLIASEAKRKAQEPPPDPFWFWGLLDRDDGGFCFTAS
jgi:hypothetical protein